MAQRALVTGGAGFIGSHVAEALLDDGWEVTVLDDLSRGKQANVPARATFVEGDVRSAESRKLVATGGFDLLNLQAAQIDVRHSVADPSNDADINLMGLVNLLSGASEGGVKRVVFASSGGVLYGEAETVPTSEAADKRPVSPYGVSKLAGEHYLRCLAMLHGFEHVSLRYANVFGPRQDPKGEAGVVSIFLDRLESGQPLVVFGDGSQTRDYVFVRDVAQANLCAATAELPPSTDHDSRAFNVGTGREITVTQLADIMSSAVGRKTGMQFDPPRAGELARSALDTSRARSALGWAPQFTFEDGLTELVRWYRSEAH